MNARPSESNSTAPGLVTALVDAGIIAPEDRAQATEIVRTRLVGPSGGEAAGPASTLVATLLGYVGGILVIAAGAVFLALRWSEMSHVTRVSALAGGAAVLAAAALTARFAGVQPLDSARRQLVGVLVLGAAALSAGAFGTWLEPRVDPGTNSVAALAFGLFTLIALAGYVLSPSLPGQLGISFGAMVTTFTATDYFFERSALPAAIVLLALGVGWLALAETGHWREDQTARLIGGALVLIGAQAPLFDGGDSAGRHALAYLLLTLAGGAGFAAYLQLRQWPYLGIGVVGLTLAATEAAVDYIEGSGAAIGLLVAGAVLLITSMAALRLRRSTPTPL